MKNEEVKIYKKNTTILPGVFVGDLFTFFPIRNINVNIYQTIDGTKFIMNNLI